jgi:hypothetical protein
MFQRGRTKVRSRSESAIALFGFLWFYKCGVKKDLCVLFGDINILLPAANNLEVKRGQEQLTYACG